MRNQFTPEELELEEWRPSPIYEGVEVSSLGRVRQYFRESDDGLGYKLVLIQRQKVRVHVLVAEAFHGLRPEGHQANHKDGVKANNRASNLEWVTRSRNIEHAYQIGLHSGRSGITPEIAIDVINSNELNRVLAERYGTSLDAIRDIRKGRTWRHVTEIPLQPRKRREKRVT